MLTNQIDESSLFVTIKYPEENSTEWVKFETSYRLLDLSDPNLLAAFEGKKEMFIRGGVDDDAVLCTNDQTFRLREIVTSNMFLVLQMDPSMDSNGEMKGTAAGKPGATLEATPMTRPPGIDQLIQALNSAPFNGGSGSEDGDEFEGSDYLHIIRLYENVQASAKEIEDCLKEQGALIIKGKNYFIFVYTHSYIDHYRKLGCHFLCRFF